jgi:SOS-response transcriptional repressor LexA
MLENMELSSMTTLGDRIREGRKNRNLTQADLANALGISVQAISQWESGKTVPTADRLIFIGDLLGMDLRTAYFAGEMGPYRGDTRSGRYVVPLVSRVAPGHWTETIADDSLPIDEMKSFEIYWPPTGPTFALEIDGESMLPEFKPGDVIIVDTGIVPIPGDYVVAALDGEKEATFKKYRPRGNDASGDPVIELAPLNPDYPTLTMSSKFPGRIIGTMREHRSFRRTR